MKKLIAVILVGFGAFLPLACSKGATPTSTTPTAQTPSGSHVNGGVVSTFAGSGSNGHADNMNGQLATFDYPHDVTVDAAGNVFVADNSNYLIRKISPSGAVTTLAGTAGSNGYNDSSNGLLAQFNYPHGVAVDQSDNVYVADLDNQVIREISATGAVTTLAGIGNSGYVDGSAQFARFDDPYSVAVDSSGNVYVADEYNNAIRKISNGTVSTLAGSGLVGAANGTGQAASFHGPHGVAVDASGNVYVSDSWNNLIRKITPAGLVSTYAGGGSTAATVTGPALSGSFNNPQGLAVDAWGTVYVADRGNNMIRAISPSGVLSVLAGQVTPGSTNATGTLASFDSPFGVAVDTAGNVYVADGNNDMIREIQ